MASYRPDPRILDLGPDFYDSVEPAKFPKALPRFLNDRWAGRVGLALDAGGWEAHFARFEQLPDNLTEPLALKYHGHQFRVYNPEIGDGRGFTFAQPMPHAAMGKQFEHTATVLLFDRGGRFIGTITPDEPDDSAVASMKALIG